MPRAAPAFCGVFLLIRSPIVIPRRDPTAVFTASAGERELDRADLGLPGILPLSNRLQTFVIILPLIAGLVIVRAAPTALIQP